MALWCRQGSGANEGGHNGCLENGQKASHHLQVILKLGGCLVTYRVLWVIGNRVCITGKLRR